MRDHPPIRQNGLEAILGKLALNQGLITQVQLRDALAEQFRTGGGGGDKRQQ